MVSFSRCVLAISALLLSFQGASAQFAAGTLGGACTAAGTCNTGLQCLVGICTISTAGLLTPGTIGGACLTGNVCNTGLSCLLNICTITTIVPSGSSGPSTGLTPGTIGGTCLVGNTCNAGLQCLLGFCTIGTGGIGGAGALGGACKTGNICNTGLSCLFGICTIGLPAGGEGGACTAAGTCNAGLSCFFGICASGASSGGFPTGSEGGMCTASGTCNTGLTCFFGICANINIDPTCATNADCGGLKQCNPLTKKCTAFVMPSLDCASSPCSATQDCRLGLCVPKQVSTCTPACGTGQTCAFGNCIQSAPAACTNCASSDLCLPNFFAGTSTCIKSTSAFSCSKTSDCSTGVCQFGTCIACGAFCDGLTALTSTIKDNLLNELANVGASFSSFTSLVAPAAALSAITAGNLNVAAGSVVQVDASVTGLQNLAFAAANAAARIEAGVTSTLTAITSSTTSAQLLVGVGSKTTAGEISITAGAAFSISMGGASSGTASPSITEVAKLTLNGPLNIVGNTNSVFRFPSSAAGTTGTGSISVSGGISLTGNAGNAPINFAAAGNLMAAAKVDAAAFFESASNLLGKTATFTVNGYAALSGSVIEPTLVLAAGAKVSVSAKDGTTGTIAGDVSFNSAISGTANLIVNGTASAGANVYFRQIKNCPSNALITYNVVGSANIALATGFTLFNYAASTYASVGSFTCRIQVCGSDNVCVEVKNPNTVTASGRRLLASDATASFTPTGVTAGTPLPTGGVIPGAASQIKIASTLFALLVALVVALMIKA